MAAFFKLFFCYVAFIVLLPLVSCLEVISLFPTMPKLKLYEYLKESTIKREFYIHY